MDQLNKADELDLKYEKLYSEDMGLEYEEDSSTIAEDSDEIIGEQPFNSERIRVDQQMLSVKYMLELMNDQLIDMDTDFQRKRVWKDNKRKSLLIESLMLRIPIPAFYFYENESGRYQVIDGLQRLYTIRDFVDGKFRLTGLEYLGKEYNKKKFKDLDVKYVQRIYRTQIAVNILDARSPKRVIYDIFRRVNTGGVNLNPQEMRNAICKPEVRKFLKKSTKNENYKFATRSKINDDRMDSQELTLRFYAFYQAYDYDKERLHYEYPDIATMLDYEIEELNKMNDEKRDKLYCKFEEAMWRCYQAFGDYCFSKITWENNEPKRKVDFINKSLFSAFSTLLLHPKYDCIDLRKNQKKLLKQLALRLESDHEYANSLTIGTGDRKNVYHNFQCSKEVLEQCLL